MDSSLQVSRLGASRPYELIQPVGYSEDVQVVFSSSKSVLVQPGTIEPSDLKIIEILNRYDAKQYQRLMSLVNPFYRFGKSIFSSRSGIRMANIDAIFRLVGGDYNNLSTLPRRIPERFTYAIIGDHTQGVISYFQYRSQYSLGYEMYDRVNYSQTKTNIQTEGVHIVETETGSTQYGGDQTGNLLVNIPAMIKRLNTYHYRQFKVVVGWEAASDIGFAIAQILAIVSLVADDGSAVLQLTHPLSSRHYQLLYILKSVFDRLNFIRPVTSYNQFYRGFAIATGAKKDRERVLEQLQGWYGRKNLPANLIESMSDDFVQWVSQFDNHVLTTTTTTLKQLKTKARSWQPSKTRYNLVRLAKVWDVPSGP